MTRKFLYALTIAGLVSCTLVAQARPGLFSTLSFTSIISLLNVTKFGTHMVVSGGTGLNILRVQNTTAGTANAGQVVVGNDVDGALGAFTAYSSTYTTSGAAVANTAVLSGSAALNLASGGATPITFYSGNGLTTFTNATLSNSINMSNIVGAPAITMPSGTFGAGGVTGSSVQLGYNTSGSGAAGYVGMYQKNGTFDVVWPDATGVLRIGTAAPTANGVTSDTSGTIVGTQTSTRETKRLLGHDLAPADALAVLLRTPVHRFQYRSGAYQGTVFHGIVADESPAFVMDAGRSFNPISAFGYSALSIQALQREIDELRAEVRRLKRRAR